MPTYADLLTGRSGVPGGGGATTVSVGNVQITVSGAGDPRTVAQAVVDQFEAKMNDLADRQRQRGGVW